MSKQKNYFSRKVYSLLLRLGMYISIAFTIGLILFMVGFVFLKGLKGLSFEFISTSPSYLSDTIGILPDILNTVYILLATLAIVVPMGVGSAIYLEEYAQNDKVKRIIEQAAETLSGIPSVIYGLAGMLIFCQFLSFQTSLIAGALTLAVMNLPTIMRTTQESLKTVPDGYRQGAYALGAGKWRVIYSVILPSCVEGIITGCILSAGRIIGESAALLFTAGLVHQQNGFFAAMESPGATLSVALYVYAKERGEFEAAFAIALILMTLSLIINLCASLTGVYFKKRKNL